MGSHLCSGLELAWGLSSSQAPARQGSVTSWTVSYMMVYQVQYWHFLSLGRWGPHYLLFYLLHSFWPSWSFYVLVHSSSYNKNTTDEVAYKQQKFIFHRLGRRKWGSLRSRCWQFRFLVRTQILAHRSSSFCCNFTWQKGPRELSMVSFISALIPLMRAPPSSPDHLSKTPTS